MLGISPAHADRMALWNIVHGQCVVHFDAGQGPKPCVDVDEKDFVALLKDLNGVAQELAIPTTRVTGIEDPAVLAPYAPNYFAYAWRERAEVEKLLKHPLPREAVGVAVNSSHARSQDQLHLHVDCMKKDVVAALADYLPSLDDTFTPMTVALDGRKYWARRIDGEELGTRSPFQMLATAIAGAKDEMGLWSLILVGATFSGKPGFVLLADHAELIGGGHAEDLQDHECAIRSPG
ncbi:MAG: CDP-diacylglycerol diphosphatase [Roseiarcus sp.]